MSSSEQMGRPQIPTTGMRGGLGRTLLTAFLILAIVPLSTISWYATRCERRDIEREVIAKLSSVAAITENQIGQWIEQQNAQMRVVAALQSTRESVTALANDTAAASAGLNTLDAQLHTLMAHNPSFRCLAVHDNAGRILLSTDTCPSTEAEDRLADQAHAIALSYSEGGDGRGDRAPAWGTLVAGSSAPGSGEDWDIVMVEHIAGPDDELLGLLSGWLNLERLARGMFVRLGETGEIYLVGTGGVALPQGHKVNSTGIAVALDGADTEGLYENYAGVPVIGVYRWMPELHLALVAEQTQEEAFGPTESVGAAVIGATLIVALATAVIAALVTRQITRPIVQLTESAVSISSGDMRQHVPVASRDEIGILAYVFNHMAAELKALYDDLEDKVAQRTALLQQANYQIQRRAIQLATTVEVSQAATSILEPDQLLREVVHLVRERFDYWYVGIYLLGDDVEQALLQAASGGMAHRTLDADIVPAGCRRSVDPASAARPVVVGDGSASGQTLLTGKPSTVDWDAKRAQETFGSPYIRTEAALPLRMGDQEHTEESASPPFADDGHATNGRNVRIIGALDILSTDDEQFSADDISVLQNVANQITIALENARAYAVEREAAKRLRELDRSKRRFLANMSHELRTPLTNILGFSRMMLKGFDGPLTEEQNSDMEIIHHNGQHLLGLINDLLDISHIEAGLMELEFREVDLVNLIHSVMATASALVRDKDIELREEIAPDLPTVQADETRIRQVLLRLLANAAKFTEQGTITVRSWSRRRQDEGTPSTDGPRSTSAAARGETGSFGKDLASAGRALEVVVAVQDTGVGIPPEDQKRIFEHFEQGGLKNGGRPNGAGLGLALSREFVEMHGGEIWVESQLGKGSTFTLTLPCRTQEARGKRQEEKERA